MSDNYQVDYTQAGIGYIQQHGGTFPIRLQPEEWTSGDINWLLDVIAPNPHLAAAVVANFGQVVKKGGEMRLHPIVARLVGREMLESIGVRS